MASWDHEDLKSKEPGWDVCGVAEATRKHAHMLVPAPPWPQVGWPADQKSEDTFELPPLLPFPLITEHPPCARSAIVITPEARAILDEDNAVDANALTEQEAEDALLKSFVFTPEAMDAEASSETTYEYRAKATTTGPVLIKITTQTIRQEAVIATFNHEADASAAAEALNNHEGY